MNSPNIVIADSFFTRALGLMFRKEIGFDEAMYFPHCTSVHTLGMRASIDVIFLSSDGKILRICEAVPPLRVRRYESAYGVLEMAAGSARLRGYTTQMKVI